MANRAPAGWSKFGPSLEAIEAAREIVGPVIKVTPMESSRVLTEHMGSPVHLKLESLQRTGSYKIRGAYHRMSKLTPEERARGVVAASAGNHAQGVALAARELGIEATIFMPVAVALPKLQATKGYGASVVLRGHTVDEPLRAAAEYAEQTGAIFISPFDHEDIITGQGTLGLEILDQVPDVDTVIVPVGGGGLISGVASAVKQVAQKSGRSIRVIGVQSVNSASYVASLESGEPVTIRSTPTIADGIAVGRPGDLNFPLVRDLVDDIITVSDDDTSRALIFLLERAKLVVEPAGAVAVAAILTNQVTDAGTTVAILSGGNIDPLVMDRVIAQGLAASDRFLKLRIKLPDRPGQLARISALIGEVNANVIEVSHTRHGKGALLNDVDLEVSLETRGPDHVQLVLERLREAEYDPRIDF